jgi:hypothetical protein
LPGAKVQSPQPVLAQPETKLFTISKAIAALDASTHQASSNASSNLSSGASASSSSSSMEVRPDPALMARVLHPAVTSAADAGTSSTPSLATPGLVASVDARRSSNRLPVLIAFAAGALAGAIVVAVILLLDR